MKTLKKITYLLLLIVLVTSCDKDYDTPPLNMPVYNGAKPNITIKGIKEKYASVTSAAPELIEESLIVKVLVGGNDVSGNIYKQLIVQDETGGISIGIDQSNMYSIYRVGQEVFIDLKGLGAVVYGGELQIGYVGSQANRIPWEIFKSQAHLNNWPDSTLVAPKITTIKDLDVSMTNTVIQLDSVYFVNGGKTTFTTGDNTTSQTLKDNNGNSIDVRTSSYSKFAKETLPLGVGTIIGELGRYNGSWQFTIRSADDIKNFSGVTPGDDTPAGKGTGTKEDPYDITNAIAKQGETDKWVKGYIVGAVPAAKISEAQFTAPFEGASNVLIAASADETDPTKCFPVQLVFGTEPRNVNLKDTPANKGKEVSFKGNLITYFGVAAMKETSEYVLVGGTTPEPEPTGTGTGIKTDPYDIANAIAKQGETDKWVKGYIVGAVPSAKIAEAQFTAPFEGASNVLIAASADETDPTKCFPIQLVFGTEPRNINLKDNPTNKGKEVIFRGNLTTYFGVAAMKETSEVDIVGGGAVTPDPDPEPTPGDNDGTKEKAYNVTEFLGLSFGTKGIWLDGYIVGCVPSTDPTKSEFATPFSSQTNFLVAASAGEKDVSKCIIVQLPSALRAALGLKDTPSNLGKRIKLKGDAEKYFNVMGMKNASEYEF